MSTLEFIDFLLDEFRQKAPQKYGDLSLSKLREKVSRIIKGSKTFLSHSFSKSKNFHSNYKFSIKRLNQIEERIRRKFGKNAEGMYELIDYYKYSNRDLKLYPRQQYHHSNPELNERFFEKIDSKKKAYWLGFLSADGSLSSVGKNRDRRRIKIEISPKDKNQLIKFCNDIGITTDNIKTKITEKNGKIQEMSLVQFICKPIEQDLIKKGFLKFKKRENFPFVTKLSKSLYKAFLLGYFDGDGNEGQTVLTSKNKNFLEQLKNDFNIQYEIRLTEKGKRNYRLTLGAKLFNSLLVNYKDSLERKRIKFSEVKESGNHLKKKIVDADKLQLLINTFPKSWIADYFEVSWKTLQNLCYDWNIKGKGSGYWNSARLKIARSKMKLLEQFCKKNV